ncbi:single-strand DNA-binding protein [Hydrogenispora ethanolica]|jgi:single-strand DNA-binding protein|uniref:Single-stranded DNA-binding protein n=1 Tax=Hydrogenispora ethanolica TaxID=1082276 RepID=A0A4R1RZG8_HYDET|nr:single-stranded DNA-binding protein [Hydrogenispora ethanolica]TCL71650.1 single-strand DNA-binding protein [Hydrogenispora ethanolica]
MNHIVLIGRLTRDPELRYTPSGTAVTNFDLAVDRPVPNQQGERETDFIRIIAWQKQAELCANYLKKGRLVAVEGRLQIRSYETQDGQKRRVAEVVANQVQFLDKGRDDATAAPGSGSSGSGGHDDLGGVNLDDLPF